MMHNAKPRPSHGRGRGIVPLTAHSSNQGVVHPGQPLLFSETLRVNIESPRSGTFRSLQFRENTMSTYIPPSSTELAAVAALESIAASLATLTAAVAALLKAAQEAQ